MKTLQDKFIIGVDHGYGNMKTANHCFKTGMIIAKTHPRKILQKSYHRSQICFPLLIAAPLPKKPPPPTMKPKEVIRWNDT